jgi:hypothetical protein
MSSPKTLQAAATDLGVEARMLEPGERFSIQPQ